MDALIERLEKIKSSQAKFIEEIKIELDEQAKTILIYGEINEKTARNSIRTL